MRQTLEKKLEKGIGVKKKQHLVASLNDYSISNNNLENWKNWGLPVSAVSGEVLNNRSGSGSGSSMVQTKNKLLKKGAGDTSVLLQAGKWINYKGCGWNNSECQT